MPKQLNLEESYNQCVSNGMISPQEEIDVHKIKSMIEIVNNDLSSIKRLKNEWNTIYKLNYDVLRVLVEAFLRFDNVKSHNHQCLFTYLCVKHPELELNWDFFEKVRTKRNGINYYGTLIIEKDWKEVALQFSLYIKLLKEEVEKKLEESKK